MTRTLPCGRKRGERGDEDRGDAEDGYNDDEDEDEDEDKGDGDNDNECADDDDDAGRLAVEIMVPMGIVAAGAANSAADAAAKYRVPCILGSQHMAGDKKGRGYAPTYRNTHMLWKRKGGENCQNALTVFITETLVYNENDM